MTGDLVLDTSVVIAALRGVPGVEAKLDQVERLWLPVIALGELELGVELASNAGAQRAAVDAFLSAVVVLTLTNQTARHYARLRAALSRAGTPIPENDLWIAALAVERGWPVATRDAHFVHVPGLTVQDWS
ncbi:MAG TPA: type II toxin-antitoxin system VapC family toxin [Opitutaceae bacterium]|nr:type II toxin-antitoxin system VapC family toxin [Opitutaceae bacterium]